MGADTSRWSRESSALSCASEPAREQRLEECGICRFERGIDDAAFVREVSLDCAVDEFAPRFGQGDDASAAVVFALAAAHEPACFEPVDAFRHGTARDHRGVGEFAGGAFSCVIAASKGREDIELALAHPVFVEDDGELVGHVRGESVQSTDERHGRGVELGANGAPFGDDAGDVIGLLRHPLSISSASSIVVSMETTWRWILIAAIAPIAWGSSYYVTREFLPADAPLWGAVLRALPAGLVLLALRPARPRGHWWWRAAVLGSLNMGVFFALVYLAAQLLPTSVASTIMALAPIMMMGFAWLVIGEHPRLLALIGGGVGVLGVVIMLAGEGGGGLQLGGVVASVGAMTMSSLGYVLAKRWSAGVDVVSLTSWQLLAGGLVLVPIALIVDGPPPELAGTELLAFAYLSLFATALAFVAWFSALRHLPASAVGLVGLLNPVTGVLLGTLVAGEVLTPRHAIGIALVLAGVLLGQPVWRSHARAPARRATRRLRLRVASDRARTSA